MQELNGITKIQPRFVEFRLQWQVELHTIMLTCGDGTSTPSHIYMYRTIYIYTWTTNWQNEINMEKSARRLILHAGTRRRESQRRTRIYSSGDFHRKRHQDWAEMHLLAESDSNKETCLLIDKYVAAFASEWRSCRRTGFLWRKPAASLRPFPLHRRKDVALPRRV